MKKTTTTKPAAKAATKTKNVVVATANDLLVAVNELLALGIPAWKKTAASLRVDDVIKGGGRLYDNYYGNSVYFKTYADGVTAVRKEITKRQAEAVAEALRAKTTTKIAGVAGYTAVVSSAGIELGCQRVSLAKFAEVAKAVDKANAVMAAANAKTAKTTATATAKK